MSIKAGDTVVVRRSIEEGALERAGLAHRIGAIGVVQLVVLDAKYTFDGEIVETVGMCHVDFPDGPQTGFWLPEIEKTAAQELIDVYRATRDLRGRQGRHSRPEISGKRLDRSRVQGL